MTALANFRQHARGGKTSEKDWSPLPDTHQPGVSITHLFPFQSYFDSTFLENALLQQSKNEPIVNSLSPAVGAITQAIQSNVAGYSVGLHPSSQTPVAVQFLVGGQPASAQPTILKPGQIYRPHGRPYGRNGNFSGINWGLPFGWLGGGIATLYVFSSPDADVAWPGDPEVIFHRQRMQILAPASLPAAAPFNWPMRFPWTNAARGATPIDQAGMATIAITNPTRVLMSLRLGSLAAASRMRILFQGTSDFDLDSSGNPVLTPVRFQDYVWGTYTANGGAGDLGTNYPVVEIAGPAYRLAADDGGVQLVDMSASTLTDAYVDVVRYGKI